ncbi:hypothetical protein BV25DRAFT_1915894 [Artomyces pyxidatus]|uniref:Uncharacterized protein n=1 Tax=Artomyces pyxidatus TaxID=48021 RepID=A0ACB8T3T9_9AGAM|nr:hypothetical protein BV25DRAFT_1915894 [Artomyces pyxidatus]
MSKNKGKAKASTKAPTPASSTGVALTPQQRGALTRAANKARALEEAATAAAALSNMGGSSSADATSSSTAVTLGKRGADDGQVQDARKKSKAPGRSFK